MVKIEVLPNLLLEFVIKNRLSTLFEGHEELTEVCFILKLLLIGLSTLVGIKVSREVQSNSCV